MKPKQSYQNKFFSVLGDSLSTLAGCNPPDYAVFYTWENCCAANVFSVADTWWGKVIEELGGFLLVNNSYSGSLVCKHPACEIESYGCSDTRTGALGTSDIAPDVVMILMGLNDFGAGMPIRPAENKKVGNAHSKLLAYRRFSCSSATQTARSVLRNFLWHKKDLSVFSEAYGTMLKKIKKNYPETEIWCLTLPCGYRRAEPLQRPPLVRAGGNLGDYCKAIRKCAEENGCFSLDIFCPEEPYDSLDGYHPNADGMQTIANAVLQAAERSVFGR
ncbi:MAG: hypothetical protein IJA86_00650 [Clostridia bacterium]|nr:hypothetical protein [Clostridia bacterium]